MKKHSSAAVEDYLERILELIKAKGYARVVDIAASLGISQASVTNMIQRLDEGGFIKYEKYRGLILTSQGEAVAQEISQRHQVLTEFLTLLGIEKEVMEHDVEGMEHHLSPSTLLALKRLVVELRLLPEVLIRVQGK